MTVIAYDSSSITLIERIHLSSDLVPRFTLHLDLGRPCALHDIMCMHRSSTASSQAGKGNHSQNIVVHPCSTREELEKVPTRVGRPRLLERSLSNRDTQGSKAWRPRAENSNKVLPHTTTQKCYHASTVSDAKGVA